MPDALPTVTRVYQNHHLDSTRWDVLKPRPDDIIVTTSYKSGTTWTQQILLFLLHDDADSMPDVRALSPWPDARFMGTSREELAAHAESLEGRRFLKSHLPLDGLPYWPEAKYLVVARDPRDVFMSLFNHYGSYTDISFQAFNESPGRVGAPLERCPEDPRELFQDWMSKGWFEWEREGYPFWSNLHHTQTYWDWRHLPNMLLLHYNDMLKDLPGAIRTIADFAGIEVDDDKVDRVAQATTFKATKKRALEAEKKMEGMPGMFRGGQKTFFFKGTNGRWRDVLTDEDLELYERTKSQVLDPRCAKWLEEGGPTDQA